MDPNQAVKHNPAPRTDNYPSSMSEANGPASHDASPPPKEKSPLIGPNKAHSHKG